MENQTSFDLSVEIRSWREKLARSTSLSRASLDELESHLRDSALSLEKAGLSPEEAFLIATRRIGPATHLEAEFAKVEPRPPRFIMDPRYLYGIAMILLVLLFAFATLAPLVSNGIAVNLTSRGPDAATPQPPPPGVQPAK
jgi:hypothetical protein